MDFSVKIMSVKHVHHSNIVTNGKDDLPIEAPNSVIVISHAGQIRAGLEPEADCHTAHMAHNLMN